MKNTNDQASMHPSMNPNMQKQPIETPPNQTQNIELIAKGIINDKLGFDQH